MAKARRMSAEERRRSILEAAVPLFAKHGFNGTTTKMISSAAGISEALLYRHFPSKESIYNELKDFCCQGKIEMSAMIAELKPSTSTLVHSIYFLAHAIAAGMDHHDEQGFTHEELHRLMANSYLEDGAFARMFLQENITTWEPLLNQCIEAAIEAGDMHADWIDTRCRWWFAHHLAVALGFLNLPKESVVDYGLDWEMVLEQSVRFALRGMGLTDEALRTHYNPSVLALFIRNMREGKVNK